MLQEFKLEFKILAKEILAIKKNMTLIIMNNRFHIIIT